MPVTDLHLYERHTARRGFPGRRLELLLAQVSLVLAQVNGNKDLTLSSFLMDPPPDPELGSENEPTDDEALAAHFGYLPRRRRPPPEQQPPTEDNSNGQQPG